MPVNLNLAMQNIWDKLLKERHMALVSCGIIMGVGMKENKSKEADGVLENTSTERREGVVLTLHRMDLSMLETGKMVFFTELVPGTNLVDMFTSVASKRENMME